MKVIKLKHHERISDLKINNNYFGKVLSESLVALNTNVMAKLGIPTKLKKGSEVGVKVTKISLPYKVEVEILSDKFEVEKELFDHLFLIKSETLEKLKPEIIKAAEMIKKAISESRPIILKHHADCDGYMGAISIENSIKPFIAKEHRSAAWHYFKRTPSKSPYYNYTDAIKDITSSLKDVKNEKPPLLVVVDTGSTKEDMLSLQRVRQYGFKIIVIDHHQPTIVDGKPIVKEHVDVLINPYNVGGKNNLTAGMLGVEVSRFINRKTDCTIFAAISGMTDRSDGKEFNQYVELAEKKGYTKEFLKELGQCIDFDAYHIGYLESGLVEDILFSDMEHQKKVVGLIKTELEIRKKALIKSAESYSIIKEKKEFSIIVVEIQKILDFGSYPSSGKATGILFEHFKQKLNKSIIVLGYSSDFITIRTNIKGFDLNKMIKEVDKKIAHAQISGGGHEVAGTMRFIDSSGKEVLESVIKYIENHECS